MKKGREYTFSSAAMSSPHCTKRCTKPLAKTQAAGVTDNGLTQFYLRFSYFSMVYPTPLKLGTDTNLRPVNLAAGCC